MEPAIVNATSSAKPSSPWLKSTEWLAGQLGQPDLVVVDGSFYLAIQKRDARAEYLAGHIPGAVFFDINAVADHSSELPHMLPGPNQFGEAAGGLGIADTDTIVASTKAYINALNRLIIRRQKTAPGEDVKTVSYHGE